MTAWLLSYISRIDLFFAWVHLISSFFFIQLGEPGIISTLMYVRLNSER